MGVCQEKGITLVLNITIFVRTKTNIYLQNFSEKKVNNGVLLSNSSIFEGIINS